MILLDDNPNEAPITELFAFVSTDAAGNDGICMMFSDGLQMPCVTSKQRIADMMRTAMEKAASASGKTIKLVKFSNRTDLWQTGA